MRMPRIRRRISASSSSHWARRTGLFSTAEELNRAGGKAEGFVLGLESTKAIKSQIAESLYVAYDDAASQRATELA